MNLEEAQEAEAKRLGRPRVEVQLLWSVVADTPEAWKAIENQALAIIATEEKTLRATEDNSKMFRAQGRIQGLETFLANVEDIVKRIEEKRHG